MLVSNKESTLNKIISLVEKLEGCKLDEAVLNDVSGELKNVSQYFGLNEDESLFLSIIFVLQNQKNEPVNLHDIAEFLDYSFIHILEFRSILTKLEDEGFIYIDERGNVSPHSENNGYRINGSVINNIIDGTEIIHIEKEPLTNEFVLNELLFVMEAYKNDVMSNIEYKRQVIIIEEKDKDNKIIKFVTEAFPEEFELRIILYFLFASIVIGDDLPDRNPNIYWNYLRRGKTSGLRKEIREETCVLFEKKYIEKKFVIDDEDSYRESYISTIRLTKNLIEEIFEDEADNYLKDYTDESELEKTISAIKEFQHEYEGKTNSFRKNRMLYLIERKYAEFPFFKKVNKEIKKGTIRYILYDCFGDYLKGSDSNIHATLSDLFGKSKEFFSEFREFIDEKHFLVEEGYLEVEKNEKVEQSRMSISERTLELLYGKEAEVFKNEKTEKNVIYPEKLKEKPLFYSEEVQKQISTLTESFDQKKLKQIQKRLDDKGFSKGVAVLMHGAAGTGKTESVYQIAKKTNRKILHVDIADSKSMWFGESEKLIKKIFVNYRNLCKSCERKKENTPILLFNEADALISKRKDVMSGNVAQTENAIQNILLEEIEKLEGILIATTNLCDNMDGAFERRFLFKIKFEKPELDTRIKIWKSKLDFMSDEEIKELAESFDFSGGEIDNVVRKCEMNRVISGQDPSFDEMLDYCKTEKLHGDDGRKIGFNS